MLYIRQNTEFEATLDSAPTGLAGTIGVRILDNIGSEAVARTTSGIAEYPAGSGFYTVTLTAPNTAGQYTVLWDTGTVTPATTAAEDLVVTPSVTVTIAGDFTYDPTTDLGKLRLQIGDTDSSSILFTDQEANVYLDQRAGNVLLAAADLCDVLAVRFSRDFDFETDQQRFLRSQRVKQYQGMATQLRSRAVGTGTVSTTRVDGYSQDIGSEEVASATPASGRVLRGYTDPDVPY